MMVPARLPVAPRPFVDELLSSWMARIAARYRSEPLELMVHLAGQGGRDAGARQVDDVAPDMGLLRLWAEACRIIRNGFVADHWLPDILIGRRTGC